MSSPKKILHSIDPWHSLRNFTSARIALGKAGNSIPVTETLNFKLAHAHARDAIYSLLDFENLTKELQAFNLPVYAVGSLALYRQEYLKRPDLGRRLNEEGVNYLTSQFDQQPYDISIIISDGLSATAVNQNAFPVLSSLIPALHTDGFSIAPITLVEYGRVAIGDEIGSLLNAQLSLILIGERPGLSSPNSMGAYLTYQPRVGLTDESRNCISNIRPEGLVYKKAAEKIFYLIKESLRLKISGIALKDLSNLLD